MSRNGSGNPIGFSNMQASPGNNATNQGNSGNATSGSPQPGSGAPGNAPARGRTNKAPPQGYIPGFSGADKPAPPPPSSQPQPQRGQPISATPTPPPLTPTNPASRTNANADVEKGKDNDDTVSTNTENPDADEDDQNENDTDGKGKTRRGRRRKIAQAQLSPGAKAVCCCDLQTGVASIGFFNCVIAFIAVIIYGMALSAHRGGLCHQVGVGLGMMFIVIAIFLIFGAMNRSAVMCIIYLVSSWLGFIAVIVLIFVLDECAPQRGVFLLSTLGCGFIFKIYEAVVIYYFIKEPPPPPTSAVRLVSYSDDGYPVYYSGGGPRTVYVPYGGYGYGYGYPYGGYGYGYDPALGMMTGMGLGMAMSGGWGYDHCGYDSCYW